MSEAICTYTNINTWRNSTYIEDQRLQIDIPIENQLENKRMHPQGGKQSKDPKSQLAKRNTNLSTRCQLRQEIPNDIRIPIEDIMIRSR
jgi:hypothetical protein